MYKLLMFIQLILLYFIYVSHDVDAYYIYVTVDIDVLILDIWQEKVLFMSQSLILNAEQLVKMCGLLTGYNSS